MSEPFVGQIMTAGFNFAPKDWAFCDGQLMPISQNTALFSLLGTQFGGNGQSNFALPDLQGSVPVGAPGQGPGLTQYNMGDSAGEETHTLLASETPSHTHTVAPQASHDERTTDHPGGTAYPTTGGVYASTNNSNSPLGAYQSSAVGGIPHNNLQPYVALNYVISLVGIFPPRP